LSVDDLGKDDVEIQAGSCRWHNPDGVPQFQ
jgi:hypothetical protein